jgi:hypothetical protein
MDRRSDFKTAEKVRMALLTMVAFERTAAERYAGLAGIPDVLIGEVLERPVHRLRQYDYLSHTSQQADRREFPRS